MKCFQCGKLGHLAYRCPEKASTSYGEKKITYVQEEDNQKIGEVDLDIEKGENIMLRRVLDKEKGGIQVEQSTINNYMQDTR